MIPEIVKQVITAELQPHMAGWTTPERGIEMAELVFQVKPETVVEIGVFGARSILAQALALRELRRGKIYGIDPWKLEPALEGENEANRDWWTHNVDLNTIHNGAMAAIWKHGLDAYAIIIRACSQDCCELFRDIDILFVDGNHSEVASSRDVELYLPKVRKGGYVWFDDADWPSTQKAIGMLNAQCELVKDYGHYRLYQK